MNIEHQYKKHIISRTIFKLKYQILYVFGIEKKIMQIRNTYQFERTL